MMIMDFRKRFFVSAVLSIPVIVLSPMIQGLLGYTLVFAGSTWFLFGASSFIFLYGGFPFLSGTLDELKKKNPGMMTLIAMAILVAFFYSGAVVFGFPGKLFFWELVTLIDIMLLGHWIEMRSVMGASRALESLARLLPDEAHLLKNGDITEVMISDLRPGNRVLIKPGERIPADGSIIDGKSYINESMLTGESKPVKKKEGDAVIAGSINGDGTLTVEISETGEHTYLSRVIGMVREAQEAKSKTQRFADRAARVLTIIALSAGIATLFGWLAAGMDTAFAIERMVTVMIITCPHALGLAIPLVVAVSTAQSAKRGLLIRNRTAFERSRLITTVVFDKTGTLTRGNFGVISVEPFAGGMDQDSVLRYAASLERGSEHPVARGILGEAGKRGIELMETRDVRALRGRGIEGFIDGKKIMLVSRGYLEEAGLLTDEIKLKSSIGTEAYLVINGKPAGNIILADSIREESADAIRMLRKKGIKCRMLTGDTGITAKVVAETLGLDGYDAEVLPDQKREIIRDLQKKGETVAMTGDGINDAPALAQADIGIAIGSGTDVAAETADIILVRSDPRDVASLILFGKATHRKMLQNLFWATGYNLIAIPLAAGVLYSYGVMISPAMGAVLMSLSTIVVAVNARLLNLKAGRTDHHA